jgi:6-phosphofructokinase 2
MSLVATLTLNPALDTSTSVAGIVPDQKLHCAAPKTEAGGGGINVSRGLHRLGTPSVAVYPAGGHTGALLEALLTAEGIASCVIPTQSAVRENFVVVDTATHQQYRFGMPGARLTDAEQLQILEALHRLTPLPDFVVLSGSLPPDMPPAFLARVARQAREAGSKVVADTTGPAMLAVIEAGAYLIKPNLGELSQLAGVPELDNAGVVATARQLIGAGHCEIVVVSMGPQGACLVTCDLEDHIAAPDEKRRSTVGAGDSMVAGIVHALVHGQSLREAVRLGVACGTAATMNPGTELFHPADVEKLYRCLLQAMPAPHPAA